MIWRRRSGIGRTAVTSDATLAALAGARLRRRRSVGSGALTHEEPEGERPGGQDASRSLGSRGGAGASLDSAGGGCSARPPRIPSSPAPGVRLLHGLLRARGCRTQGWRWDRVGPLTVRLPALASCPGHAAQTRARTGQPASARPLRHVFGAEDQQCDSGEGSWASPPPPPAEGL